MAADDACEPVLRLEIPASEEYRTLRVAAGLSAMGAEGAAIGLPASWCAVVRAPCG